MSETMTVKAACSFLRLAVCRYTNIEATNVVMSGNRKVPTTTKPGFVSGGSEEKTDRMMAIAEPAPAIAATKDARNTNLSRMRSSVP